MGPPLEYFLSYLVVNQSEAFQSLQDFCFEFGESSSNSLAAAALKFFGGEPLDMLIALACLMEGAP